MLFVSSLLNAEKIMLAKTLNNCVCSASFFLSVFLTVIFSPELFPESMDPELASARRGFASKYLNILVRSLRLRWNFCLSTTFCCVSGSLLQREQSWTKVFFFSFWKSFFSFHCWFFCAISSVNYSNCLRIQAAFAKGCSVLQALLEEGSRLVRAEQLLAMASIPRPICLSLASPPSAHAIPDSIYSCTSSSDSRSLPSSMFVDDFFSVCFPCLMIHPCLLQIHSFTCRIQSSTAPFPS